MGMKVISVSFKGLEGQRCGQRKHPSSISVQLSGYKSGEKPLNLLWLKTPASDS